MAKKKRTKRSLEDLSNEELLEKIEPIATQLDKTLQRLEEYAQQVINPYAESNKALNDASGRFNQAYMSALYINQRIPGAIDLTEYELREQRVEHMIEQKGAPYLQKELAEIHKSWDESTFQRRNSYKQENISDYTIPEVHDPLIETAIEPRGNGF